ncbi:MAG: N-acyl-D-amino-acid deacylase, partial [Gaiellaceae bacterium]|nr:N-acyl-D-amino-acid deacylase [Gaiellaceae bacterium]
MTDLVFRGGLVCDGSAREPYRADVAITGTRITAVGAGIAAAATEVDAAGLVVAPGFVDVHTHSDFTIPVRPGAAAKLLQGVTTDCTGNCGFSPFPLASDAMALRHGTFFEPALADRWPSLAAYAESVDGLRPAINLAPLVGLGAVRLAVLGEDDRPATATELTEMRRLVDVSLAEGGFGVSSGLIYAPSGYADVAELASLAEVAAARGRIYATHMRNEGEHLEAAVDEALEVGRRSGCAVQISHHKVVGEPNWGKVRSTLAAIDAANRSGADVSVDVYPYTAGSTTLAAMFPAETLAGGESGMRSRLADPEARAAVVRGIAAGDHRLSDVVLAGPPSAPELRGRRLVDVAAERGVDAGEMLLDLVQVDGLDVVMIVHGMSETDVRTVLGHDRAMFGSDGWVMSTDAAGYAHPRNFAAATRVLSHYVREVGLLALPEAIRKLSTLPARRLGLADRGVIAPGAAADLVAFDLARLQERATFEEPCRHPVGMEHVLVN